MHDILSLARSFKIQRIIEHPNIIKPKFIYRGKINKNNIYIVMDYFPNDLHSILSSNIFLKSY